jgi:hypothetical protein
MSEKKTTGPPADRLKLKGNWKRLVGKALAKKRPVGGWPELEPPLARQPKDLKNKQS